MAALGLSVGSSSSCGFRKAGARNVLLISIDTLRADHLGAYGFPGGTTPHLDALAAQGVLFENVVSPVPMTLAAHSSMLTGTIPPVHGVHDNLFGRLPDSSVTLATMLKERGWRTGAIVSSFVLDARFGLGQGFDTYDDRLETSKKAVERNERKGDVTAGLARAWLEAHKKEPFFLFVHFYDPHEDYEPPEPFASRFKGDAYAGEVAFADASVGQVFGKLEELGLLESTMVVVAGDHGEMLGEHGELTHHFFVYQGAVQVPLIFRVPGLRDPRRVSRLVGLVDVLPTICGVLGIPLKGPVAGEDLSPWLRGDTPPPRERGLYVESFAPRRYYGASPLFGLVTEDWKYIETTRPELYHLKTDPGETVNVLEKQRPRVEAFRAELRRILEGQARKKGPEAIDEEARQRLQSLGYLGRGRGDVDYDFGTGGEDPKDLIGFYRSDQALAALVEAEKWDEARALCDRMLKERPAFVDGHLQRAEIAFAQKDLGAARDHYAKAVALDASSERAHLGLAKVLRAGGRPDEAIGHLQRALELRPGHVEARTELAALLNERGRFDEAATLLKEATAGKALSSGSATQLGRALASQGKLDEAIDQFRRALGLDPDSAEAHSYLGSALARRGSLDEAIAEFEAALRSKPDLAQVHEWLGVALKDQGKPGEAGTHLEEAIRLNPRRAETHVQLGLVKKQLGKPYEAAAEYRRAIALDKHLATAHNNLGSVLGAQGRLPEAVRAFREALRVAPDNDEAHNNLGLALRMMGERDEALSHFRAALRLRPDWPAPMSEIAWILATHPDPRLRNPAEAVRLAERAAERTRAEQPVILDALAVAYAAAGDFERAATTAERAEALAAAAHADGLALEIRMRANLFRNRKPFVEAARAAGASPPR